MLLLLNASDCLADTRGLCRRTVSGSGDHQIDFRRFQFTLDATIDGDAYSDDATYALMKKLGDEVGERIRHDQFAPNVDPQYDPEGLYPGQLKYRAAKEMGKSLRSQ